MSRLLLISGYLPRVLASSPAPPHQPHPLMERQRHERPLEDRQVDKGEDVRVTRPVAREVGVEEEAGEKHDDERGRAGGSRPRVDDPEREWDGREEAAVATQVRTRIDPRDQPG